MSFNASLATTKPAKGERSPTASDFKRQLFYSHLLCAVSVAFAVAGYLFWVLSSDLQSADQTRLRTAGADLATHLAEIDVSDVHSAALTTALEDVRRAHQLAAIRLYRGETMVAGSDENSSSETERVFVAEPASLSGFRAELALNASLRGAKLAEIRNYALLGFIGAVLLALLFSRLLANRVERSITVLVERLEEVAAGKLDARMHPSGDDAMSRIALSFNTMSERLSRTATERERMLEQLKFTRDQLEGNIKSRNRQLEELNELFRKEHEQRARLEANLAEAAATDPLTKLLNRRSMLELLRQVGIELKKTNRSCCLAVVDVDHFKQVNDRFGHDVGDAVLAGVSNIIRQHSGADEAAARWGGEEFLVAWPDQPISVAEQRANRLRELIADEPFAGGKLRVSASFGVTQWQLGENLETALKRADRALYEAKSSGRNRVCVHKNS